MMGSPATSCENSSRKLGVTGRTPTNPRRLPGPGWRCKGGWPATHWSRRLPSPPPAFASLKKIGLSRLLGAELPQRTEPVFHMESSGNLAVFNGLNIDRHHPETFSGVRHAKEVAS